MTGEDFGAGLPPFRREKRTKYGAREMSQLQATGTAKFGERTAEQLPETHARILRRFLEARASEKMRDRIE